ncbi:hypothetical protein K466DRAFT_592717 [Polyporus arcularius HHB13444]|uniref:Uncharacterized protein n=1 Tax=Polyporus arcularius HHB13444 TaxID=1314778 RepID=A0A5C3NRZ7_9APHY|nr:hypothetical protein K466DRAFT_592717 [Polyporus arcularius HHB13444]
MPSRAPRRAFLSRTRKGLALRAPLAVHATRPPAPPAFLRVRYLPAPVAHTEHGAPQLLASRPTHHPRPHPRASRNIACQGTLHIGRLQDLTRRACFPQRYREQISVEASRGSRNSAGQEAESDAAAQVLCNACTRGKGAGRAVSGGRVSRAGIAMPVHVEVLLLAE